MEAKIRKVSTEEVDSVITGMAIFDWKVIKKEINGTRSVLTFERDENVPYYDEMVKKEKAYEKETNPSSLLIYIFVGLALVLMTTYLIVSSLNGGFAFDNIYFYAIMIPGLVSFLLSALFLFLRVKKIQKILANFYERRREVSLEMEELRQACTPKN